MARQISNFPQETDLKYITSNIDNESFIQRRIKFFKTTKLLTLDEKYKSPHDNLINKQHIFLHFDLNYN